MAHEGATEEPEQDPTEQDSQDPQDEGEQQTAMAQGDGDPGQEDVSER